MRYHSTTLDGGNGLTPSVPQHVEALGAVVHGVGGDVGEDDSAREYVFFAFAGAGDGLVEREAGGFDFHFIGGLIEERDRSWSGVRSVPV